MLGQVMCCERPIVVLRTCVRVCPCLLDYCWVLTGLYKFVTIRNNLSVSKLFVWSSSIGYRSKIHRH